MVYGDLSAFDKRQKDSIGSIRQANQGDAKAAWFMDHRIRSAIKQTKVSFSAPSRLTRPTLADWEEQARQQAHGGDTRTQPETKTPVSAYPKRRRIRAKVGQRDNGGG